MGSPQPVAAGGDILPTPGSGTEAPMTGVVPTQPPAPDPSVVPAGTSQEPRVELGGTEEDPATDMNAVLPAKRRFTALSALESDLNKHRLRHQTGLHPAPTLGGLELLRSSSGTAGLGPGTEGAQPGLTAGPGVPDQQHWRSVFWVFVWCLAPGV